MAVDIAIKGVPDALAAELRRRADEHHRSPDEEALAILAMGLGKSRTITFSQLLDRAKRVGGSTPAEAADMVREDRDGRPGR